MPKSKEVIKSSLVVFFYKEKYGVLKIKMQENDTYFRLNIGIFILGGPNYLI